VTPAERAALCRAISPDRLATYTSAAAARGCDVLDLYIWDRDVAAAAMADIAILEVAMRNAMSAQLAQRASRADWYSINIGLDTRSLAAVTKAWGQVPQASRTPGRVTAQLMFGFWRELLEAGGSIGVGPLKQPTDYEAIWRSDLRKAFPGGRSLASSEGSQFTRTWTLGIVKDVHALRNRAAHHEPLVNSLPIPGESRRITIKEGRDACLRFSARLDRDLHTWMTANSRLALALAQPI